MREIKFGRKWFEIENGLPRLYLHEKNEKRVRWALRTFTGIGIALSIVALDWYLSLSTAIGLVVVDWFLERTLFYYSSLYVDAIMDNYDPDEWVATVVVSIGEPTDPTTKRIIGLAFRTEDYAARFFEILHRWNCSDDYRQNDLKLTFVIDEDMYYVYLYSTPDKETIEKFRSNVEEESKYDKYGKEHFMLVMQQIFCKGFETAREFALGMFLDNHPQGEEFLLAPYIWDADAGPRAFDGAEPILMRDYKSKLAIDLDRTDYEYFHWIKVVNRTGVGTDA